MNLSFTDGRTFRGSFLVYLNGVEVPAVSVNVQAGVWQIPQASIVLPPDKELIGLGREDKVKVAIFYLDQFYSYNGTTAEEPQFRLLFEGEVTGSSYNQRSDSFDIALTAVAKTSVLTQIFPMFIRYFNDIVQSKVDTSIGSDQRLLVDNPLVSGIWFHGFDQDAAKRRSREFIKRPYDFVENLLRGMISVDSAHNRGSAAQAFFAKWARLGNYHNTWVPCPYLETRDLIKMDSVGVFPALKAVQSQETIRALQERAMQVGNEGSLWDLIQMVFSTVYYEVLQMLAPPILATDLKTGEILGEARWGGEPPHEPVDFNIYKSQKETESEPRTFEGRNEPARSDHPNRILSNVTKPQLMFGTPPACNVIYPCQTISKGIEQNFAAQPTRLYISDPSTFEHIIGGNANVANVIALRASTVGYPPQVHQAMGAAARNPKRSPFDLLVWPEEFFKGPVVKKHTYPSWFNHLNRAYLAEDPQRKNPGVLAEQQIYQLFASYEFHRERASQEYGHVTSAFDPYIVPGFPGVILDPEELGIHFFAYFGTIQHSLSQNSMQTTVHYTFAQDVYQFFETLWKDRHALSGVLLDEISMVKKLDEERDHLVAQLDGGLRVQYNEALRKMQETEENKAEAAKRVIDAESKSKRQQTAAAEAFVATEKASKEAADNLLKLAEPGTVLEKLERLRTYYTNFAMTEDFHYAPASAFPDVRYRFQNADRATKVYASLFHGQPILEDVPTVLTKSMAFDWRSDMAVRSPEGDLEPIHLGETRNLSNVLSPDDASLEVPKIVVQGPQKEVMNSYESAMKWKSRPVCTLEEYIDFHGSFGVREGPVEVADLEQGKGARFYERILDLKHFDITEEAVIEGAWANVDTRKNWTEKLLRYRRKILSKGPITVK